MSLVPGKKSSASVPRRGRPSPPRHVVTIFRNRPLAMDVSRVSPFHPKILLVSHTFHPKWCWSRSLSVFLQSIGLELIISSRTASDFDSTLSLHYFSLTSTVLPIRMAFLDEGFPAMPIRMGFLR